jgi:hypothetical protein
MAGPTNRARKYGGGGGGIDLGGLLMAIYGGVTTNPEAAMQGPTPSGQALGGGDPYKARTIFDRNEASSMNAQYRAGQMAEDSALSRRFEEARGMLPIKKDDYLNQQSAQTTGELARTRGTKDIDLEYRPKFDQLDTEKSRIEGNNQLANTLRMIANPENLAAIQQKYTPEQLARLIEEAKAGTTAAKTANIQSGIQGEVALKTKPDLMNLAPAELQYKLQQIQSGQRMMPRRENAEIDQYARENALGDLQLRIGGLQNMQGGLYDPVQGGWQVPPPVDPMQAMAAEKMGMTAPSYRTANPRMINAVREDIEGIQVDAIKAPAGPPMPPLQATPQALTNNVSAPQQDWYSKMAVPTIPETPEMQAQRIAEEQRLQMLKGLLSRLGQTQRTF